MRKTSFKWIHDNLTSVWRQKLKSQERKRCLSDISCAVLFIYTSIKYYQKQCYIFRKIFVYVMAITPVKSRRHLRIWQALHYTCIFLFIIGGIYDSKCYVTLLDSQISRCFRLPNWGQWLYWRLFLMQISTQYFKSSVVPVIKIYPELNSDFECPHSNLEICHKSQHLFTIQKRWH